MDEVQGTFELALLTSESLHGADRVALDAVYRIDIPGRAVEVDRSTDVGATLALILLGYLRREYGSAAFRMKRTHTSAAPVTGGAQ
jgi:hypothetical protein